VTLSPVSSLLSLLLRTIPKSVVLEIPLPFCAFWGAQLSFEQSIESAKHHYAAGRLDEAEAILRQVLVRDPDHAACLHALALMLHRRGLLEGAIEIYLRAAKLRPDDADVQNDLGAARLQRREFTEAIDALRRAVSLRPNFPEAHTNLGTALTSVGHIDEALQCHRKAIELRPDLAAAHFNLANALRSGGRLEEAVNSYRRALQIQPDQPEVCNNLGLALQERGHLDDAIEAFGKAVEQRPNFPQALSNLGSALNRAGHFDQAITACRRAIGLRPDYAEAHANLAGGLCANGEFDEAITVASQALAIRPDLAEAYNVLGNAWKAKGRLDQAMDAYRRALAVRHEYADALSNLGIVLQDSGRLDEAIECFRRASAWKGGAKAADNFLLALHYHPDWESRRIYDEHVRWNRTYAKTLCPTGARDDHNRGSAAGRRLRVGYVSPDFNSHAVGRFLLPLLANHDHSRFEIFCYSDVTRPDEKTQQLRSYADVWRATASLSDQKLDELIRADRIDILVDLTLHSAGNRLLVFARKPAPVQVTYLAYCSTSGLETMDFRLTDHWLDPIGADDHVYCEKSIRLPNTYWCYPEPPEAPAVVPLPAVVRGQVTFGCLNNYCKVSRPTLETWRRLLAQVHDSRLIVHSHDGSHRADVREFLAEGGIDQRRVEFIGRLPMEQYFRIYHEIDIALDPFPFPGGTTTCDALWMGVPVVSLAGPTAVSRGGLSILSNVGLPGLVAPNKDDYLRIATSLAGHLTRLAEMRCDLRQQMRSSPLMDARRFARDVEAAYYQMAENQESR